MNQEGQVVRTYTFSYGWGIYRVVPVALKTVSDYDGVPRMNDFSINLTTLNDLGGPTSIYYRINNGATRSVAVDGQPHITTQGANNILEYWSVDSNGIAESPHNILTGISLERNVNSQTSTGTSTQTMSPSPIPVFDLDAAAVLAVIVLFAAIVRKRRREHK